MQFNAKAHGRPRSGRPAANGGDVMRLVRDQCTAKTTKTTKPTAARKSKLPTYCGAPLNLKKIPASRKQKLAAAVKPKSSERPENRNKTTKTTANRKHQAEDRKLAEAAKPRNSGKPESWNKTTGATASKMPRTADFPVKPKASHFQKNKGSNAKLTRTRATAGFV